LRLRNINATNEIGKTFSCNNIKNYNFYHNSSQNKRGVGILIDCSLNYDIIDTYKDLSENILGLKIIIDGQILWIVSIYGPNTNDATFFNNLIELINGAGDTPFVIGGDWNTTVCTLNNHDNIDTLHMASPPSFFRSQKLEELSNVAQLTDPFRALWPAKRDYTYVPRSGRRNRSRIDFFKISDSLLQHVADCDISESLHTNLFDHKPIFLKLGSNDSCNTSSIFNSTVNHPMFMNIVITSTVDTYLNHAAPETPGLEQYKHRLGSSLLLIRQLNDLEKAIAVDGSNEQREEERLHLLGVLEASIRQLPDTDTLNNINLTADPDSFFEILAMDLKNNLTSFQCWLKKVESATVTVLKRRIIDLKKNYLVNSDEIAAAERALTNILDTKLQSKVSSFKIFENLTSEKPKPAFLSLVKNRSSEKLSSIKKR
jgi:exonuclease III